MANKHLYNKIDSEKLKYQMQINFMGNKDLADATGLSITAIQNLLKEANTPRPKNLKKICEALKCSQFDLLKDE